MKWVIDKEHQGLTIKEFLRNVHQFSRRILVSVKQDGKILVNGSSATVRYILKEGDILELHFPKEITGPNMKPEQLDLKIVYEDDAVIVIDKLPGMATMPSSNHPSGTVANGVLGYFRENGIPYTVHVVTRLDRDTSGLLLIAKNRYSHSLLANSQKTKTIERKYKAIVEGTLQEKEGIIDLPIDRKEDSIIERVVKDTGKRAVTHYKTKKQFADFSLVEVKLETGRTHQIRVHFSHINHPLCGDDLYGGKLVHMKRHALHCYELQFEHPFTKEVLRFHSSLPNDMKQLMNNLDFY